MLSTLKNSFAAAGVVAVATMGLAGLTNDSSALPGISAASAQGYSSALVGAGCKAYAAKVPAGPGSVAGLAADPVAVAASHVPLLTTLTSAVSGKLNPEVHLVDTLDGGEFTVFAPVDSAFAKIDHATIDSLKTDSPTLTKILTYHVVPGQIEPEDIDGEHATVEGGAVTVTGSGDDLKVDGASVICGGIHTANATVYLIDTVLMPPTE
ncbi:beta-Ig-H3/fasciclin [Segniliparus rotundus DSM 44985]|uniref:Beta-Ig-H3/fasciclin n=1 Tax=Segniliparus rotundus (strain ATCC BAA-972 / CDC 1076 / CIP 108378 / DSM 44985 / JCM 13578) TaxID=640132 RepID=D6ZBP6_SEGRD|nr:fasciclin domain-containing protein [Segniliparus rotundus]ADG96873.1 beta-Ig-H3/fasciclin [Segniliparus rotundus DSM 44985]